jgi:hypothetical protein
VKLREFWEKLEDLGKGIDFQTLETWAKSQNLQWPDINSSAEADRNAFEDIFLSYCDTLDLKTKRCLGTHGVGRGCPEDPIPTLVKPTLDSGDTYSARQVEEVQAALLRLLAEPCKDTRAGA